MERLLSDRVNLIDSSGIRKVFALAGQLKDPVNFSIGQPDFEVPEEIKAAAIEAIEAGQNRYSQTAGDDSLLEELCSRAKSEYEWEEPEILVTSGVSGAILLTFLSVVNPGDEVILPDPYFVIYKHVVNMLGGRCVFVDSYPDFTLPVEGIRRAITDRTKVIVLNSPSNPTGLVYSEKEIRQVADVAAERGVLVVSDEIYEEFCYEGTVTSIGKYYENVLVLKGFSKSYAMTGWRMGYVAAPSVMKKVIEAMTKIQQYTFVCAPTPFQKAAMRALNCDMSDYVALYRKKRDLIYNGLKEQFEVVRPGGAFYIFVKAPEWARTATEFVEHAIKNNVLIIPGNVFSEKDSHFRISYATTDAKIAEGVEILCRLAKD